VLIRPFVPSDYPAIAAVRSANGPDWARSAEDLEFWDEHRDQRFLARRWVAELDGRVVGWASYDQVAWMYDPHRFILAGFVHPELQGRGIGGALYQTVADALTPLDPATLLILEVPTEPPRSVRFVERRGFREAMRTWALRLDLGSFDPTPFQATLGDLEGQGIAIASLADLADDPGRDRKLFDLVNAVHEDVPTPEANTPLTFEHFVENMLTTPELDPDLFYIASSSADGAYVGLSTLWTFPDRRDLRSGITGVTRPWRRRGLALALKLRAISYARAQGYTSILTTNAAQNQGMLALNERLGFVKQYALIDFQKEVSSAT
jgi:GNAT superfamily N-acetyltransferase